jgi:hypothetical protein
MLKLTQDPSLAATRRNFSAAVAMAEAALDREIERIRPRKVIKRLMPVLLLKGDMQGWVVEVHDWNGLKGWLKEEN